MKTIFIQFTDFPIGNKPENSLFFRLLSERYHVVLSENPEYLFFSVFGNNHLKYNCIKIFWTGENQSPDFNLCDYAIGFDYIQFGDRHCRFPLYYMYKHDYNLMCTKNSCSKHDLELKTNFCGFVYSNNHASPERQHFFNLVSKYKQISSGGRFLNNTGTVVQNKLEFQRLCKFSIAFENASSPGYITEKLIQSFAAQTIPIYWGDPTVNQHFNTKSFINCHDYASFEDVLEKIKQLDNDDKAYLEMLQAPALLDENNYEHAHERLCAFLFAIFDQDLEEAKRYNREYWGRKYINKQRETRKAYDHSLKGLAERCYMHFFRKLEKKKKSVWLWKMHKGLMKLLKKN